MKKVLIISSSIRFNSNSELLAKRFYDGAKDAGNDVTLISLKDKNIAFCKGCMACQKLKKCVINDDANEITDKICESDVIVWVTPVYYYEMSGQMKTVIDRANSLFVRDYRFKEVYLLAVAHDSEIEKRRDSFTGVQGWIDCFEGVTLKKALFVGGVGNPNEINGNPKLEEAYEMGKNV